MKLTANQVLQAMYDGQTLVYGHRGAKAYAPMNTLPAFELAAEQGAQGVELDVQRSVDGYPVVVHDALVDATTDGKGRVTKKTLAELKALDAGAWFNEKFAGVPIPTLDEVFEAVGKRLYINVELKTQRVRTDGIEQVVAECIRRHAMERRVVVSSFNPQALRRFRPLLPNVPIGYLTWSNAPAMLLDRMFGVEYEAYHPEDMMVSSLMLAKAPAQGRIINVWTVNNPERAKELKAMGVHGIITDKPDLILAALKQA